MTNINEQAEVNSAALVDNLDDATFRRYAEGLARRIVAAVDFTPEDEAFLHAMNQDMQASHERIKAAHKRIEESREQTRLQLIMPNNV